MGDADRQELPMVLTVMEARLREFCSGVEPSGGSRFGAQRRSAAPVPGGSTVSPVNTLDKPVGDSARSSGNTSKPR